MSSNEFEKSKVFSFRESVEYSEGGIVSKTVLKKQTGNISLFSFAKGEALSEHTAPFDAMIQVVDGSAEITIGGTPFIVSSGETPASTDFKSMFEAQPCWMSPASIAKFFP